MLLDLIKLLDSSLMPQYTNMHIDIHYERKFQNKYYQYTLRSDPVLQTYRSVQRELHMLVVNDADISCRYNMVSCWPRCRAHIDHSSL